MMPELNKIYCGDALMVLKTWPDEFVQCVITSPPYWGLRDYGIEGQVWDGDKDCEHEWGAEKKKKFNPIQGGECLRPHNYEMIQNSSQGKFCINCGAWLGSLGLEPTPEMYVEHLVEIFREVRRVLRKDGTLWLNMGDCYAQLGKHKTQK